MILALFSYIFVLQSIATDISIYCKYFIVLVSDAHHFKDEEYLYQFKLDFNKQFAITDLVPESMLSVTPAIVAYRGGLLTGQKIMFTQNLTGISRVVLEL